MSKTFRVRPSQLLGVADVSDYLAFCLDRAVWYFGSCLEADLDDAEMALGNAPKRNQIINARRRVLNEYLALPSEPVKGQYADPAHLVNKRR